MSAAVAERPARTETDNGGVPARRAVVRWAWRLLRHEWRQQLLILALITVAVAATFVGSAVATNMPPPANAGFGSATDIATLRPSPQLGAQIAAIAHRFGRVDVIENQTVPVPGSVNTYSIRAQNPRGAFGQPMLSLVTGQHPSGAGEVALSSGAASELHLRVGDTWRDHGAPRRVVGIVANPQNLLDDFALVAPGQVTAPTMVTVLFDAPGVNPHSLGPNVVSRQSAAAANAIINPVTISLAAATLGMLLIALVSVGGFTVLAHRRLRSIGMLGAQGATDANVGLVISANGFVTGAAGAVAGFALGLAAWLAYRPRAEASAHHVMAAFQLPWLVIIASMVLAVLAAYLAAVRPARAIARMPIVTALAGRPPAPRPARRWDGPAGIGLLALAFFLIGLASEQATSASAESGNKSMLALALIVGLIVLCSGIVLAAPTCLALLARAARHAPVVVRLALRDLARYRTRSGAALGAISLSVLIAVIICVVAAGRFGNALDYVGPNLASNQLVIYPAASGNQLAGPAPNHGSQAQGKPTGGSRPQRQAAPRTTGTSVYARNGTRAGPITVTDAQRAAMAAQVRGIGAMLGSRNIVQLEITDSALQRDASGRNFGGTVYVATPQLLRAFGIRAAQVSPDADILTTRPGLSSLTRMQLDYGSYKFGPPGSCAQSSCLANPTIEHVSGLPTGTSAPNTVITEHAVHRLHLTTTRAGWLIQTPVPLTSSQISTAQHAAAAAGLAVESRDSIPTISGILDVATIFGILLALGILAMSVGLLRSETASSVRTLTATGASGRARRAISATTAGALAVIGAIAGTTGGYVAAFGFFRTNQLDTLSSLSSVPVTNLLLILLGMPLVAVIGGWLLAGREPTAIGRRPLE